MLLCRQAEPARGGEIERAGVSGNLSDHAGKLAAFEPFLKRKQSVFGFPRFDTDHPFAPLLW